MLLNASVGGLPVAIWITGLRLGNEAVAVEIRNDSLLSERHGSRHFRQDVVIDHRVALDFVCARRRCVWCPFIIECNFSTNVW